MTTYEVCDFCGTYIDVGDANLDEAKGVFCSNHCYDDSRRPEVVPCAKREEAAVALSVMKGSSPRCNVCGGQQILSALSADTHYCIACVRKRREKKWRS